MDTDADWEEWGRRDPYYGVLTFDKYRREVLTAEAKEEFFETGRAHVRRVIEVCRRNFDPDFSPKRVLDFGCGAGRLVIPFAEVADHVVGLDVSSSMLMEAERNCRERSVRSVELIESDDELSGLDGAFDLIHSVIVFQHIPVERGKRIFANLLRRLEQGGILAVHVAYSKTEYAGSHGLPPAEGPIKRLRARAARGVEASKGLVKRRVRRLLRREPPSGCPQMQMNSYSLNELFFMTQSAGMRDSHVELTDHHGELGAFLYFRRPVAE